MPISCGDAARLVAGGLGQINGIAVSQPNPRGPQQATAGSSKIVDETSIQWKHILLIDSPDRWRYFRETITKVVNVPFASQAPQKASSVMAPIGGLDRMQMWLEEALKYKDCREAMQKLLAQIGSDTNFAPSHTDILDLFHALRNQTGGGGIFVDVTPKQLKALFPGRDLGKRQAGGGGDSNLFYADPSNWRTRQRWSAVYIKGVYSDRPAFERLPYDYLVTLIHEITHNAPNDSSRTGITYEHDDMNAAAKTLGSTSFDQYVKEHCIPKKYW